MSSDAISYLRFRRRGWGGTYSTRGNRRNVKRLGRDSGDGDGEEGSEDGGLHDCDICEELIDWNGCFVFVFLLLLLLLLGGIEDMDGKERRKEGREEGRKERDLKLHVGLRASAYFFFPHTECGLELQSRNLCLHIPTCTQPWAAWILSTTLDWHANIRQTPTGTADKDSRIWY